MDGFTERAIRASTPARVTSADADAATASPTRGVG